MVTRFQPAFSVRSDEVSAGHSHWALLHCSFVVLFFKVFLGETFVSFETKNLAFQLCEGNKSFEDKY